MMNSAASKLGKLENVQIMEHIQNYFNELSRKNRDFEIDGKKNTTVETYNSEIRMYFYLMRDKEKGKELEYLSMDDINITQEDYEDYIDTLCSLKDKDGSNLYVNKTINKKTSALKGLIRFLKKKKVIDVDISYLELIKGEKERDNHYGVLETWETLELARLALQEKEKGEIKRLLILFALDTCIRKSAILNLKWSNFTEREDGVLVQGIDKGNKDFRQLISKDFYQELITIKGNTDKVFNISGRRVNDMMLRLINKMGIIKSRNIVFHSIRKCGVTFRYRLTGDILEAQRAAGHSNITTTQIYLKSESYGSIGAVSSKGKIDVELYKSVDQDVLVEAISLCQKDFQLILNLKIQEIIDKDK
jgi:integrase